MSNTVIVTGEKNITSVENEVIKVVRFGAPGPVGPIGPQGPAVTNPTQEIIPVKNSVGTFDDSPLTVLYDNGNPVEIVSSVTLSVPSGTLEVGGVLDNGQLIKGVTSIKDAGVSFLSNDRITGVNYLVPLTPITNSGIGDSFTLNADEFVWGTFGGADDILLEVPGDKKICFAFTQISDAFQTAQRVKGTYGKIHYRVIDLDTATGEPVLVYTSEQYSPLDFSLADENNILEYQTTNPNFLRDGHMLMIEIFSADGNDFSMYGQTIVEPNDMGVIRVAEEDGIINDFLPYFETFFTDSTVVMLANQPWVEANFEEVSPGGPLFYGRRNDLWVQPYADDIIYYNIDTGLPVNDLQEAVDYLEEIKVDEAPEDNKLYSRKDKVWVENNAEDTVFDNTNGMDSVDVQAAIEELYEYDRGVMCFMDNATFTVLDEDVPTKITGTYVASTNNRNFTLVGNALRYDGTKTRVFDVYGILDVTKDLGLGLSAIYEVVIYKNGVATDCSATLTVSENLEPVCVTVHADLVLTQNDLLELYITNTSNVADALVTNAKLIVR